MDPAIARQLWLRLETVNAVAYFCQECRDDPADAGLRGFWMGYFGCRAAPLGPVPASVVEATFYNFHPDRVRRAIPDAWALVTPHRLLEVRRAAAATALRRVAGAGPIEEVATSVLPAMRRVIDAGDGAGRPLFAANREVFVSDEPSDPVEALWQAVTTLREHRGDGHLALLAGAGLDGCEVHVLGAADESVDPDVFMASRGWTGDDWRAAVHRLAARGLVAETGSPTVAGRALRAEIERHTDELAVRAYESLGEAEAGTMLATLDPVARVIAGSGEIRYPNPMVLPSVADA